MLPCYSPLTDFQMAVPMSLCPVAFSGRGGAAHYLYITGMKCQGINTSANHLQSVTLGHWCVKLQLPFPLCGINLRPVFLTVLFCFPTGLISSRLLWADTVLMHSLLDAFFFSEPLFYSLMFSAPPR